MRLPQRMQRRDNQPRGNPFRRKVSKDALVEQAKTLLNRGREALGRLSAAERVELGRIVVKSRGRYKLLTRREQSRLRELVAKALLRD